MTPEQDAKDKDKILNYCLKYDNGGTHTLFKFVKEGVCDSREEIERLIEQIRNYSEGIADVIMRSGGDIMGIKKNTLTQKFIDSGGFFQVYIDNKAIEDKEEKSKEKSNRLTELRLKTFKPLFGVAILSAFLSLYNFINGLFEKTTNQELEKRIELLEQEQLQETVSPSNQEKTPNLSPADTTDTFP